MTTATATGLAVSAHRVAEGCVAYLVSSGGDALAVDPRLDQVEDLLESARAKNVRLRAVIDTHTHADHLSGARRLAARAGAELLAHEGSRLEAPARRVAPGSSFSVGPFEVKVLAAPGHTPDSAALLVEGDLFTGDALFLEGVARTDFPGGSPEELLETLERFDALPASTVVHPGHDYQGRGEATLGDLRAAHPVLSQRDRSARRERLGGKGAAIPDIRHFLAWNLGGSDPEEMPARAAEALARGRSAALIDVRTPVEVRQRWIEGATAVPLSDLGSRDLPKDRDLVLVCSTGVRARQGRDILAGRGLKSTVLEGGLAGWRSAGLPIQGSSALPIDRQVQLIVGGAVLAGALLGAFVTPWALIVPAFFGTGLLVAGSTGFCGLAHMLSWLPWNRAKAAPESACGAGACSAGAKK